MIEYRRENYKTMTDKELKDYCKTCSVEPPAMKFKCPECEHNPDKEQIMIDGCNVGGCKYLNTFSDCDGYHYYCDLADDIKNEYCEHYRDCYFKQLARKTQECEEYFKQRNNILEECKRYQEEIGKLQKSQFCVAYEKDCHKVCKQQNCAIKNSYSYRKALEEIEPILELYANSFINPLYHTDIHYDNKSAKRGLDIINKAKGGEDER